MKTLSQRGNETEVRITGDSGGAKGSKQARFDQVPTRALYELAEHTGKGTTKYPDKDGVPNFRFGYKWGLSYAAAMRHMVQFWDGEDYDEETGSKHVIAAAWHMIALATFMDEHADKDDRYTTLMNKAATDEA
jgi:hypothetical protein